MIVLSLFDGMSCGQIALKNLGFKIEKYFASEIKRNAIKCTQQNFPDTVQLGNVKRIKAKYLPPIDLLIGGSPCQDFSGAGNRVVRRGLRGERSGLFFEYVRILKEAKPKFFLLENVGGMTRKDCRIISDLLEVKPIRICGSLVSAAKRGRLFWTNIGPYSFDIFGNRVCEIPQPEDRKIMLNDVLEYGYSDKKKHSCLLTNCGHDSSQRRMIKRFASVPRLRTIIYTDSNCDISKGVRYCTQKEMERFHNIPEGYTKGFTKQQAGDLIGDGWTVGVIEHIFSFLTGFEREQKQQQKQ